MCSCATAPQMAFVRPSVADLSYLHARHSAGRGSVQLAGLPPAQRDLTSELQQEQAAGNTLRVFLRVRPQMPHDFPVDDQGREVRQAWGAGVKGNGTLVQSQTEVVWGAFCFENNESLIFQ